MNKVEFYERYAWPLIEKGDPLVEHEVVLKALECAEQNPIWLAVLEKLICEGGSRFENERLKVEIGGIELENPLLLAAGFDKDGSVVESMYRLGFSSVVVGTVLAEPQAPNDGQIIFRPKKGTLINRMGFPSEGVRQVKANLERYKQRDFPIGLSIGLNRWVSPDMAQEGYAKVVSELDDLVDYWVINVSSPNTVGLRDLQERDRLSGIVEAIPSRKPVFIKIAPDLSLGQVDEVIRMVVDRGLAGIVATNTSTNASIKSGLGQRWVEQSGGVSGEVIRDLSNSIIRHIYAETSGKVEVVGVGGVSDLKSLLQKFESGVKVVKLFTGLIYKGPTLPSMLNRQLCEWMDREGVARVSDLVGLKR